MNCSDLLVEIQRQDGTNQYTKDYSSFQFKRIEGEGISITSVYREYVPRIARKNSKRRKVNKGKGWHEETV